MNREPEAMIKMVGCHIMERGGGARCGRIRDLEAVVAAGRGAVTLEAKRRAEHWCRSLEGEGVKGRCRGG